MLLHHHNNMIALVKQYAISLWFSYPLVKINENVTINNIDFYGATNKLPIRSAKTLILDDVYKIMDILNITSDEDKILQNFYRTRKNKNDYIVLAFVMIKEKDGIKKYRCPIIMTEILSDICTGCFIHKSLKKINIFTPFDIVFYKTFCCKDCIRKTFYGDVFYFNQLGTRYTKKKEYIL